MSDHQKLGDELRRLGWGQRKDESARMMRIFTPSPFEQPLRSLLDAEPPAGWLSDVKLYPIFYTVCAVVVTLLAALGLLTVGIVVGVVP